MATWPSARSRFRPRRPPALIGALSYSALSDFKNCGYRFYVERVLGIAEPEAPAGGTDEGDGATPEMRRRFGPGLAAHALLEWSARSGWRDPGAERAATALHEYGLGDDAEVERALASVRAFLDSPLRVELEDGTASAEAPFVLSVAGTLVRGSIDLLFERADGSALVVDYKTDRLQGRDPKRAAERYQVQRDLYALAAAARGAPVETAYVFLERPDEPVRETYDQGGLDEARVRIEELLARLSEGSFEVTHHPHLALCHDCPARDRLCSHETAAMMRDDPDPSIEPAGPPVRNGGTAGPAGGEGKPQLSLLEGG
jgi:ATP-dependent helicase/nuclease subunit A